MSNQIQISAKNLGELAMPSFYPRCFGLKRRLSNKLPFQIFPGIFSSIDSYTKDIINGYFDKYNRFPAWLGILGSLIGYKKPPHFSKFNIIGDKNNEGQDASLRIEMGNVGLTHCLRYKVNPISFRERFIGRSIQL